jgi:hypothetical protein
MNTGAAQSVLDEGSGAIKSSPDWVKTTIAAQTDQVESDGPDQPFVELKYRSIENAASAKFAKGIGLFSMALGLAEVVAPTQLASLIGLSDRYTRYLPLLGAREIAHGVGIMKSTKPTTAVWTRVTGDAIDLAFLGSAFTDPSTNKLRLGGAVAAVAGVTLLDLICAQKLSKPWTEADGNPRAPSTLGQSSARH